MLIKVSLGFNEAQKPIGLSEAPPVGDESELQASEEHHNGSRQIDPVLDKFKWCAAQGRRHVDIWSFEYTKRSRGAADP